MQILALLFIQAFSNRTMQCTARKTLFDVTETNYDSIIGASIPVFARMQNEGCVPSQSSEGYWREAAELFPNIRFVRAECIYHNEICHKLGAENTSPSHSLFKANSTTPSETFANPAAISQSSAYYSDLIYKHLGYYPFDCPTIEDLIPQSTNKFFENHKYPIFILYDSNCEEDSEFVAQWFINVNEEKISSDDYGYGKLDCSLYPDECAKWGQKYPSANVFSKEKGISISITENDNIGARVKSVISALEKSAVTYPTPQPYQPPSEPSDPTFDNVKKIEVPSLQSRDVDEIRSKYTNAKQISFSGSDTTGSADAAQCSDVQLRSEAISDVLKILNFYRELAGLPHSVTNDANLNDGCYQAAKFMSVTSTIAHIPNELYKSRCDSFPPNWEAIKTSLAKSNLEQGFSRVAEMVSGLITDEGENNEGEVGHRRWFLYPYLETIGVGYYPSSRHQFSSYTMEYKASGAFSISHNELKLDDYTGISFVSWPPAGPFPIERMPSSWSITYKQFRSEKVSKENITIKLTRDDGKVLKVSRIDLNQGQNDPLGGCLVFKLPSESLNLITADRSVHVQVYILNQQIREVLDYTIKFFDASDNQNTICFYGSNKNKCPSSIPDSMKFGSGKYSNYNPSTKPGRVTVYVAEDISASELNLNFASRILVIGGKINGKVIIGVDNEVEFSNPSSTDIEIEADSTNLNCGVLRTQIVPKSISVVFKNDFTMKSQMRSLLYVGPYSYINVGRKATGSDYMYFIGLNYKEQEAYLVCKPFSIVEVFCQGGDYFYSGIGECTAFDEFYELAYYKVNKRKVKVYARGTIDISPVGFNNVNADYEILCGSTVTIQYSTSYANKAKTITVRPLQSGRTIRPSFSFPQLPEAQPLILKYILTNHFPLTNFYFINVDSSYKPKQKIPDLLGDEQAKKIFGYTENDEVNKIIFNESVSPFADSNGNYKYTQQNQFPMFITNGLHSQYTFSTTYPYSRIRIQASPSSSSKAVTFVFPLDAKSNFKEVYIQNYQDVTIKSVPSLFGLIKILNVSKARFVNLDGGEISNIETDITGGQNVDLVNDKPIDFNCLYFRSDSVVDLQNSKSETVYTVDSSPKIKNFEINQLYAYGSTTTLSNCSVKSGVFLYVPDIVPPTIYIKDGTKFNPSLVQMQFLIDPYAAKLLEVSTDLPLVFAAEDKEIIKQLASKVSMYDLYSQIYDYKLVMSKDGKGLFLADSDFDESEAPESASLENDSQGGDEGDIDIPDQSYDINPPPPGVAPSDADKGKGDNKGGKGLKGGAIAGIVIAVILAIAAAAIAVFIIMNKKKKVASTDDPVPADDPNKPDNKEEKKEENNQVNLQLDDDLSL